MGRTCGTYGQEGKSTQGFGGEMYGKEAVLKI